MLGKHLSKVTTSMWALPVWGGGLNPCPDGLGHFFREEFSKFKRAFAWLWGGLNPCPDGLGHLFRDEPFPKAYNPLKWENSAWKKCPRVPIWVRGGCNCYLGNAQIEVGTSWKGLPLTTISSTAMLSLSFVNCEVSKTLTECPKLLPSDGQRDILGYWGSFRILANYSDAKNFKRYPGYAIGMLMSRAFWIWCGFCCYNFLNRSYGCWKSTESEILAMLAKIRVVKKN